MRVQAIVSTILLLLTTSHAFTTQTKRSVSTTSLAATTNEPAPRRQFLSAAALVFATPAFANALDMEAFASSQLEKDKANCNPKLDPKCMPKMTQDEALCKYGQSGNARGEACKRVKEGGGELPKAGSQGKTLGGAYAM